ncbi:Calcineurin-like metallo-phosphoesterase superfamily protein [Heracleum sosnowskyi]|uniref:Calcineurin-like metallo-phosphoesterase superfamily protein n=1 Tax=Heracleum sosnowskyi TaxID=360622 RepID=A0AAD8I6D8_9APIA|nr:Calcineurin-like metallo-phosphoesterase superfamily protein [Heracleum sosnowskyi]
MDHIAAAQERLMQERLKHKLDQVNSAVQTQLSQVHDHVNFTLQKAYFRCAYECFDRRRKQENIGMCTENCSVPVLTAHHLVEDEMASFQEKLNRSLMSRKASTHFHFLFKKLRLLSPSTINLAVSKIIRQEMQEFCQIFYRGSIMTT